MAICTLSTSIHISLIILYAIVLAEASLDIVSEKTTFEVGDTIVINCTTVSHSAQSVQWFFNSNPIPEKQYTVISADLSQLVIPQSNFSNAGNYSCALLEALLEEIATVQIQVGEKPHPVSSFNCFSFNGIDILCTWDDGGLTNIPTTSTLMYKAFYAEPSYPGFDWTACPDSSTSVDCPDLHSYTHSCFIYGYDHHYGSRHNFTVIAENALGTSATWIHFNPEAEAVPFAPSNIKAVAESGQCVDVSWDYPCGWEHPEYFGFFSLQYRLRYKSEWDADEWAHPISQDYVTNKRVCTLEGYTQYSIQLSAGLTGQTKYWSDWSDIVVVRTLEQAPISHLEMSYKNLDNKDESSKRDVTVFWKPLGVRQMKGEVLGYTITMSEEGENITISWNASANATSQVLQGLEKYASYDIQVVTFNSAGSSPPSLLTILDLALAPSEPLRVSAVAIDKNTILVGWEPPEFPRGRIREYKIYWRSSSSELNLDGSTNKLQYEVEGLQDYVLYEFYIQAYRADGGGGLSQAVSQYTKEAVKLGAAEITNISATSRSISLRWQPPHTLHSRNNGNPIPMPDDYSILYNITYCIPSEPSSCIDVNIGSAEFVTLSDKIFPWTTYEITLQGNILHLGYGDLARVNVTTDEEAPVKGVTLSEDRQFHNCDYSPDKRKIGISWEYVAEKKYWRGELRRCEIQFWYLETHCDATVIERTLSDTSMVLEDMSRWKSLHIDVYTCNYAGCKASVNPIRIDAVKVARDAPTNISAFETSSSSFYVTWARPANNECIKSYNVRYTSEFYQGETEVTDQCAHITKVPSGAEYTVSLSANIYKGYDITDESEPRLTTVILPDKKRTTIIVPAILVAWMILCLSILFYCRKHRVMIYEHCFKSIRKKDFSEHMDGMLNDRPSVPSYDESFLYDTLNNTSISTSTYHVNASVSVASVTESSLSTTTECKTNNFAHTPASTMTRASQDVSLLPLEDILLSPPTPDDNSGSTDIEMREVFFLGRSSENLRSSNDSPNDVLAYATLRFLSASRNDVVVDTHQVSTDV